MNAKHRMNGWRNFSPTSRRSAGPRRIRCAIIGRPCSNFMPGTVKKGKCPPFGKPCNGTTFAPISAFLDGRSLAGPHPAPLLRLAHLLQVYDSSGRGYGIAHQEPGPPQTGPAIAEVSHPQTNGRFACRAVAVA